MEIIAFSINFEHMGDITDNNLMEYRRETAWSISYEPSVLAANLGSAIYPVFEADGSPDPTAQHLPVGNLGG